MPVRTDTPILDPLQLAAECRWELPPARDADADGIVAIGADLEPATLVNAYARGLFPMRLGGRSGPLGWWSPDQRGIMPIDGFLMSALAAPFTPALPRHGRRRLRERDARLW